MSVLVWQIAAIVAATFISEDLTTIATGLLTADGRLPLWLGTSACAVGIWAGDVGLWAAGRVVGSRLLRRLQSRDRDSSWGDLRDRLADRPGRYILASRFLPGTRLPLYLSASALGISLPVFAAWSALGVALWVPLVVGLVTRAGEAAAGPLRGYLGSGWFIAPLALGLLWQRRGRAQVRQLYSRLRRWEFWPAWLFYAPVTLWVGWLFLRYGPRALSAANPGIEDGGFVGESKTRILEALPRAWTLGSTGIASGPPDARVEALRGWMARTSQSYPIILKPDVGQRGIGVTLARNENEAADYLGGHQGPVIAQVYHPGPYEAGIFYYRVPDEARGHIFSITDKRFPMVVGDGESTLERLILDHPRYRMQARTFLTRLRDRLTTVPRAGETVRLGILGNHAQGALFLDGSSLETEALAARIDEIARQIDGFYVGRFDIRYRDPDRLMAGVDFAIVELNGVTSEATHIYDPSSSLFSAYRTLARQWSLVFRIGATNLRRGCPAASFGRLVRLSFAYLTTRPN